LSESFSFASILRLGLKFSKSLLPTKMVGQAQNENRSQF
jgi:hypothetical protein